MGRNRASALSFARRDDWLSEPRHHFLEARDWVESEVLFEVELFTCCTSPAIPELRELRRSIICCVAVLPCTKAIRDGLLIKFTAKALVFAPSARIQRVPAELFEACRLMTRSNHDVEGLA
eukprot:scaffold1421_cov255-Pinguiococcus_pyrenoidosus.AAC.14